MIRVSTLCRSRSDEMAVTASSRACAGPGSAGSGCSGALAADSSGSHAAPAMAMWAFIVGSSAAGGSRR